MIVTSEMEKSEDHVGAARKFVCGTVLDSMRSNINPQDLGDICLASQRAPRLLNSGASYECILTARLTALA